jgi:hypothetical protein
MRLDDLQPNTVIRGILPDCLVTVVAVQWYGSEALELTYKDPTGRVASVVEPLPHQITAVYEVMLPRQPLRFLLADDPGARSSPRTGTWPASRDPTSLRAHLAGAHTREGVGPVVVDCTMHTQNGTSHGVGTVHRRCGPDKRRQTTGDAR